MPARNFVMFELVYNEESDYDDKDWPGHLLSLIESGKVAVVGFAWRSCDRCGYSAMQYKQNIGGNINHWLFCSHCGFDTQENAANWAFFDWSVI